MVLVFYNLDMLVCSKHLETDCNAMQCSCSRCRFVELLWQLSLHALREVHRRTFAADVASNPLPAPLTDVAFSHAATLLPVTKVVHF